MQYALENLYFGKPLRALPQRTKITLETTIFPHHTQMMLYLVKAALLIRALQTEIGKIHEEF